MENISLSTVVRNMYDRRVEFIKETNNELEREEFSNSEMLLIMQGQSFEDHLRNFKKIVREGNNESIEEVYMTLQEFFLFSYGHDLVYKKKLEADAFTTTPMEEFLYPRMLEAVKEKYNDVSVMQENPNLERNLEGIDKIISFYIDMQSLLYLVYTNDFQFVKGWERLLSENSKEIIEELEKQEITIQDFLSALVDDKCKKLREIMKEIPDATLRREYLEKIELLAKEKKEEIEGFAHSQLKVTYFKDHSVLDFIMNPPKRRSILEPQEVPTQKKKILIITEK